MNDWSFAVLLHNLSVDKETGNDYIKIVPCISPFTESFRNKSKFFCKFIDSFKDQFGRKRQPSLIFIRNIEGVSQDYLVNFRNILSISTIPKAWSQVLSSKFNFGNILYSDYFDIYGLNLSKDEKYIIANTPSIHSLDETLEFKEGQPSEKIALFSDSKDFLDESLFQGLMDIWTVFHIYNKKKIGLNIFRSLEIAYRACSLPFGNIASINDFGTNISQWVSAFEILVHPRTGRAGFREVQQLLGSIRFASRELTYKKYKFVYKRNVFSATSIQKTYFEMYRARNKFLHGEPVRSNDLFINNNSNYYALNNIAPIIYKYALQEIMGINERIVINDFNDTSSISKWITLRNAESILLIIRKMKDSKKRK